MLRFARLALLGSATTFFACSAANEDGDGSGAKAPASEAPRPATTEAASDPSATPVAIGGGDLTTGPGANPTSSAPLARGITIDEVVLYQGTRVPIAKSGARVASRVLPVIQGRDALVRLFVTPQAGKGARALDAELTVMSKGHAVGTVHTKATISQRSNESDVASTFNFMVPGSALTPDAEYTVRILESGAPSVATTTASPAQFPTSGGTDRFDAQLTGTLKVLIVPLVYGADGSNRMPDVSAAVIDAAKKRLLEFYPVADVDIRVRQPIAWSGAVLANGQGWDDVLDAVTRLRLTDNAPRDVYYYGAFAPAPTVNGYCGTDCLLGLSNMSETAGDSANRASVGVLYADNDSIDTLPHELGHAHGRPHAPCGGATDPDPKYPYPNAGIGAWGYSVVTRTLQPPTLHDQMSYCAPAWQSDYTYRALFDRIHALATMRMGGPTSARTYRMLRVASDGTTTWSGEPFTTTSPIEGHPTTVSVVAAEGTVPKQVTGYAYGYDHAKGGVVIVPTETLGDGVLRGTARARIEAR